VIIFDTGAIFALNDKSDGKHEVATQCYRSLAASGQEFVTTQHVIAETWWLVARRKNVFYADKAWDVLMGNAFLVLDFDFIDFGLARQIREKYSDSGMSLVDATSLAACERHRISKVFTFDHDHFNIYRPTFAESLELMPTI